MMQLQEACGPDGADASRFKTWVRPEQEQEQTVRNQAEYFTALGDDGQTIRAAKPAFTTSNANYLIDDFT